MNIGHATKLRWLFVGALMLFVASMGYVIYLRGDDVPKAARDLPYNHRIEAADLALQSTQTLLGQHLRRKVAAGTPIEATMLSPAPLLPVNPVGTAAAVLSVPAAKGQKLGNMADVSVKLRSSGEVIQGKLLWRECGAAHCTVVVALDAPLPASAAASGAFAGAELSER